MRIVFSRCASEGTAVIFTCLPIWGFAISWFSICMSLPLSPTNTACPLFVVQPGSQVLRSLTFVTHCASQMVPVIFICLSAADSSAAEHRTPTNSHALRFIHASYASSLRTPSHTRGSRIWVGNCFADGVDCLVLGTVNRVPDPKDSSTHSLGRDSRFGPPSPRNYIPIEGPLSSDSSVLKTNVASRRAKTCTCPTDPPAPRRRELP